MKKLTFWRGGDVMYDTVQQAGPLPFAVRCFIEGKLISQVPFSSETRARTYFEKRVEEKVFAPDALARFFATPAGIGRMK